MAENTMVRNGSAATRREETRNARFLTPRVDIFETDTELLLCADLPGVKPDDVDLRYERGELILRGKAAPPEAHGQAVLQEFEAGDFFRVPDSRDDQRQQDCRRAQERRSDRAPAQAGSGQAEADQGACRVMPRAAGVQNVPAYTAQVRQISGGSSEASCLRNVR